MKNLLRNKIYIKILELVSLIVFFFIFQTLGGVVVYFANSVGRKNQSYKGFMIKVKRKSNLN